MHADTKLLKKVNVEPDGYDSLSVPIHRASTIKYSTAASFAARFQRDADSYIYGLYGTPTHRHLEQKLTELQGGARTLLVPSGQAAVTCSILTLVGADQHVLLPDTVYGPVRDFAATEVAALGIQAEFYDPVDLDDLRARVRENTRMICVESPGSLTMEFQDVAAIVDIARKAGALVACDNSWASPLNFRPLEHGADLVFEALSKHVGGHSDLMLGSITTKDEEIGLRLKAAMGRLGIGTSPDDVVLACRGLETMAIRMERSAASAAIVAEWLAAHKAVGQVLHPHFPDTPGQHIWARDFSGSCGVFTVVPNEEFASRMLPGLDALNIFSIGASWGGTKSLLAPSAVSASRTVRRWTGPEHVLRISIGQEHPDDLVGDLALLFDAMTA